MKKKSIQKGFTLIELLIVIALISIVGGVLVSTVFSTLRGSNKGNITSDVRSEGNYVMSSMTRQIQGAQRFVGTTQSKVVSPTYNPMDCDSISTYNSIEITDTSNSTQVVGCPNSSANNTNSFQSINLSSVDVKSCSLTCSQASVADSPTIGISFTLTQPAANKLQENQASIDFSTSVKMRSPLQ